MVQKLITMTEKELLRYEVIKDLIDRVVNGSEAATQLGMSVRHTKRLKAKVLLSGVQGLAHASRGRQSNRKIDEGIIVKAKRYLKEKYADFKPSFAREKLKEVHHIALGRETVRQIMIGEDLWKQRPRKQSKKKHFWRARKDNFGAMQQFDGSYHHWLEDRQGELCLLLSVDDATGKITYAKFDTNEGVAAVFQFWTEYLLKNGLPLSVYLDKFSTYKVNHKNAQDNKDLITQFERAMNQVGVETITAHSPEAKGRVERMFKTLQDRLVKEMRLANITTIEQANKFLEGYIPQFNAKFAVVPAKKADWHRKLNPILRQKLFQVFSIQNQRVIHNDYTVMFKNQYFQLNEVQPTTVYKKDPVTIEERLGGEIRINLKGYYLNYKVLPERPQKEINVKLLALTPKKQSGWKPPASHPWKKQFIFHNKFKVEPQYI